MYQFAVLGHIEVASRLVSRVNTLDPRYVRRNDLKPLWLLWDTTNSWPSGEEEHVRDSITSERKRIQSQRRDEGAEKRAKVDLVDKPITRQDIRVEVHRKAKNYAKGWFWPEKSSLLVQHAGRKGKSPHDGDLAPLDMQETIKCMKKHYEAVGSAARETLSHASNMSSLLVSALDLSISLSLSDQGADPSPENRSPTPQEILAIIAKRLNTKRQMYCLIESRQAWTLLKDGALAKAIGLDEAKLTAFAVEIEDAIDERLRNGRLPLPPMPLKQLLEKIEHNNKTHPNALEHYADMKSPPPTTLFASPATAAEIAATEERLNIQLPHDYKAFMKLTNGFGAPFTGSLHEPPLHPLKDIRWLTDEEAYFTDLPLDIPCDMAFEFRSMDRDAWPWVDKAIEIGTFYVFQTWLIPPSKIAEVRERTKRLLADESGTYSDGLKRTVRSGVEDFAGGMDEFEKVEWGVVSWMDCEMLVFAGFEAYLRSVMARGTEGGKALAGGFIGYTFGKGGED